MRIKYKFTPRHTTLAIETTPETRGSLITYYYSYVRPIRCGIVAISSFEQRYYFLAFFPARVSIACRPHNRRPPTRRTRKSTRQNARSERAVTSRRRRRRTPSENFLPPVTDCPPARFPCGPVIARFRRQRESGRNVDSRFCRLQNVSLDADK